MRATIGRMLSLSARERGHVIEAACCLLIVRLAFGLLPFSRAVRLLRVVPGEAAAGHVVAHQVHEIGCAVARTARHLPFRAVCLHQAFAALLMLRRRGMSTTVHLGLTRQSGTGALMAHAWSRCGGVPVTGFKMASHFVPIATFMA